MRVLPLAEFVAALLGCGLCVDFEGRMLYPRDDGAERDLGWICNRLKY